MTKKNILKFRALGIIQYKQPTTMGSVKNVRNNDKLNIYIVGKFGVRATESVWRHL